MSAGCVLCLLIQTIEVYRPTDHNFYCFAFQSHSIHNILLKVKETIFLLSRSRSRTKYQVNGNARQPQSTSSFDNGGPPVNQASRDRLPAVNFSSDGQCFDNAMYSTMEGLSVAYLEQQPIKSEDANGALVQYDTLPGHDNERNNRLLDTDADENPYELSVE